ASAGAATQNVAVSGTGVSPDYTVTTTNNAIVLTDVSGNGDILAITEPSAGNIEFAAPGRVFVINGSAAVTGDSGSLSLSGVNSITVNQGDGDDTTNVGAFTSALPSLTINGDAGDDTVNLNGDITFAADANLDVDLQNDTATPGTDALNVAANANLLTSGAGTITVRCSQSVTLNAGSSFETVNGGITVEANQQATSTTGNFVGVTISGGIVQSSGIGNVVVNGRGGAGTAPNLYGVFVADAGQVKATAGGSVMLNGTGGGTGASNADYGVAFQSSGVVQVQNGPLNITGTSGPVGGFGYGVLLDFGSSGSALSNGSGAITVNATGNGTSVDFYGAVNSGFTHTIGGASATGPIMIIANNENLDGGSGTVNVQTTGAVTFKQRTSNVAINLGGGDVIGGSPTLGLSNAEINKVNAPTINFGDGNSGAITVSAGITRPAPTELNLTSGGAINLNAGALDSDGGNVTLTPGSGSSVTPASAGTDVSTGTAGTLAFSSGANLAVAINGTTADTQYQQLNVVGKVNLTGLNLTLGGSFVPAAGQSFVVVNNDGAEAINGTFDGLPQGATISNFLNSGFDATISYTGGDGNDSVITINPQPAFSIDDVTHLEGDGGTTDFTFIVTRSGATALGASVDYATQDGTATAADNDYQSAGGTLNFAAGETTKQITVHVNGDTTPELDETFKVLLGNASGATVAGGTGTGTIRNDDESASAGQLIISEFRLRGPGGTETTGAPAQSSAYSKPRTSVSFAPPSDGADTTPQANDEFVELYNNTDSPLLVTTTDGSKGWALAASDGVVRFVVPAGTLIPARGHFLGVNTLGYSLSGYPAGNDGAAATTATGDPLLLGDGTHANGYTLDIPDNMGIAVFRTANPSSFGKAGVRLDAAGSTSESNPLYKEGAGYPALAPSDIARNLQ
ncbi:MAG TPA: Calx-beta domain-containing protein, partial [Mycobacteriales bacterium]|nr:Calx-beta domain-containing protein [Mycobacteriales bacterium]